MRGPLLKYAVAAVTMLVLDGLWLTLVAARLYDDQLGPLLADSANGVAAVLFYVVYLAGLVHFVVDPALAAGSWRRAARDGAFFGLVAYATWGLTNLAVIADWPAALVPVDLAWGALLSAVTGAATTAVVLRTRRRGTASARAAG